MRPRPVALLAVAAALGAALALPAHASTTSVFAPVGAPGHADTSVVAPDGSVIVSTNRGARGSVGPSHLLRFSPRGTLLRTYVVAGQNLAGDHGTMGLAFDRAGRLYVADYSPPRVLRFDLASGAQSTYAVIPDLPACTGAALLAPARCDNGVGAAGSTPWPDGLAFQPSGDLLVTDLAQGTVFRVPPGGRDPQVWLQGPELRSTFGPNQLQLDRRGSLLLDVTASTVAGVAGRGVLYRIPVDAHGAAGTPAQVYATRPGEGPDGFALGRSGRVYLCTLVTDTVIVLAPDGTEADRLTRTPADSAPFDSPSSATFVPGGDLLVTNLTYFTNRTADDLVLRVHVGDAEVPAYRPVVRG